MNSAGIGSPSCAEQVDPAADLLRADRHPGRPVELGDVARRFVEQRPEVAAEQVLRVAAGQPDDGVGHERQPGVGVDRPDEIRRPLDEVTVAGLRFGQAGEQARVGDGDCRLVGQPLEQIQLIGVERPRIRRRDRQGTDDLAAGSSQRRRGHAAQPEAFRDGDVVRLVRDARVGPVVGRPDRLPGLRRQSVDPTPERQLHRQQPGPVAGIARAGDDDRHQVGAVLAHPGQVGPVGAEQATSLLDDAVAGSRPGRAAQRSGR